MKDTELNFFELISTDKEPPVAALFMTYGFDAELFEHHVLPNFLGVIGNAEEDQRRFRYEVAVKLREVPVTVISDGRQYQGGRTFLYDHIVISEQTFHPKCYLLLYQTFLRVIVASCNLTKAGLCYNAETVWHEDIVQDMPSGISEKLKSILIWMAENYGIRENESLKEIIRFLSKCQTANGFPKVLSTVNETSVFTELYTVAEGLKEECKSIAVISPFYENDRDKAMEKTLLLEFCDHFKKLYPKAKIRIYFPAVKSENEMVYKVTAPVNLFGELCSKYQDTELNVIHREWERDDGEPVPRTLHAKIILFELKSGKKLILSGSVNFTNNAMRSRLGALKNIEIGVLEYDHIEFSSPRSTMVKVNELSYEEREAVEQGFTPFIKSAELDGNRLKITLNKERLVVPFEIEYMDQVIYKADQCQETILIAGFKLKKSQDLHVLCSEGDFYVPIQVLRKEEYESKDLQYYFRELALEEIIDYLAGRFKSFSELAKLKRIQNNNEREAAGGLAVYFRHNLQRFFKAVDALKQGLEMPYYSEQAFKSFLSGPFGLKNLVSLIIEDYKQGVAGDEETFLFLVEIEYAVRNLHYQEDPLGREFKDNELASIMAEPFFIKKEIYAKASKTIQKQFNVLLKAYGLGSEKDIENTRSN